MKFTINKPAIFFKQKQGLDFELHEVLDKGDDAHDVFKKINLEMDSHTVGKVTLASEQMLDLGKSKNENSDSDAEYSNQFKNTSSEIDNVKRINSVAGV